MFAAEIKLAAPASPSSRCGNLWRGEAELSRRLIGDVDASYYEDRNNRGCTKLNGHVFLVLHGFTFILEPVFIKSFLHSILKKICMYIS